jgi:hypothetical protein
MPKQCPRCSLIHPPSSMKCECGFAFSAGAEELDIGPRPRLFGNVASGSDMALKIVVAVAVAIVFALVRVFVSKLLRN